MINPYYFTKNYMNTGFQFILESHVNHAKFLLSVVPIIADFGIETRYINEIQKQMATSYARLSNKFMFKYHILF